MGKLGQIQIASLVSIAVAIAMVLPAVAISSQDANVAPAAAEQTEYVLVNYNGMNRASVLRDVGASIVSSRDYGAYVKVNSAQNDYLSRNLDVVSLSGRTNINLAEQGIFFDSQAGYDLPADWKNPSTSEYLVQFVVPTESAWNEKVGANSGGIVREIGDNLVVVKMTPGQKAVVEKLGYVQWIGAWEPGFKMDSNIPSSGIAKINLEAYDMADTASIIGKLAEYGATDIQDTEYGMVTCYIDAAALPAVARLDTVEFIWNLPEMATKNSVGGRISRAHDLWVNTVSNLPQNIMGQGQIIHVQDGNLDSGHRDFANGPIGNRIGYTDSTVDGGTEGGHGTHVTGIAAGNGYNMESYLGQSLTDRIYNSLSASNPAGRPDRMGFAGRAPEATIYFRNGLISSEWAAGYTYGARIFTNSWGPIVLDNTYDATADNFMNTNPLAQVFFAAGNDGPGTNTASGSGNGKLVISVGATENMRPVDFDASDDYNQMVSFSSRGPVSDGRVKPDIVETGSYIYSTKTDDVDELGMPGLYDANYLINTDGDAIGDYYAMSGTSMACPAAAGDAILIRDYLVDVAGIAAPAATLMKGLMIHGAEDMGLGYPSFDQGWGRVNVRDSICPEFPNVLQWYYHSAGIGSGTYNVETNGLDAWVIDRTVPLKFTLVHWDAVGSGALTYDLDLVVRAPDGERFEGNAFKEGWSTSIASAADWSKCAFPSWVGGESYDWDSADDGGDDLNNVEVVRIPANRVRLGQYTVEVVWKSSTARPFFVGMTGGFNASRDYNQAILTNNAFRVNIGLDMPRTVMERDDFGEATFKCAPSGSVIVPYWINNGGTTNDAYALSTPILPTGFTVTFTTPTSPASVSAGMRVHGYARIAVGSAVVAGTYTLSIRALSNGDATAPIAQDQAKFNIDVVTSKTPPLIKIADSPAHEAAPFLVSWQSGGKDYIACTYTQDERWGERVYFTLSSDGGNTWSAPMPVSQRSWNPGYLGITRANSGIYEGRIMIAYNAWNPAGYNGRSDDTRCSYVKVHYADPPYTSWTEVNAFSLGEGVSAGNTYRTVNINHVPSVNQFYLTIEDFGYTDTTNYAANAIACVGKSSSNGGATWSAYTRIDPAAAGMYYFFPSTEIDALGNMFLYFYERDSGEAAQDRDATYKYYTGTWSPMRTVWDTLDNLMMPSAGFAPQGVNSNRAYGAYLKGANTDGDREMYITYTDNPNGNPPTWTTNLGPFGPIMSDHDYGTRFIWDMEYINNYIYVTGHRNVKYDPYGQPNMLVVFDSDFTGGAATVVDYLTLDSYVHGKQRATEIFGENKILVAQNIFTKDIGHGIYAQKIHYDWRNDVDNMGPITEYVSTSNQIMTPGQTFTLVANVQDWQTGGNNVNLARYRTDVNPGTTVDMVSMDGAFNSPAEAVATSAAISTAGWLGGWHTIWVQGRDTLLNWGAEESVQVLIVAPEPPMEPSAPDPANGATNVALSKTFSVYYEDYENNAGTVRFYWKDNPTPFATISSVVSKTRATTTAQTLIGDTSYEWYVTAQDVTGTTRGPATGYWTFGTIDNVAPTPVTNLNVVHDGPTSASTTETRYLRGVVNEAVVNGLTCYSLGTTQSATAGNWAPGNSVAVHLGARVYKRTSAGVETEITTALSMTVSRTAPGSGFQTATWTPPVTALLTTDSIVLKVYGDTASPPTTLRATFSTPQLGATQLDANQWTIQYWTRYANTAGGGSDWYWGTATYDNNIAGFRWSVSTPAVNHNTISWTKSADDGAGSNDVMNYKLYRKSTNGPWVIGDLIATMPAATQNYVDLNRGQADSTLWWYIVRAVDDNSNEDTNTNSKQEPGAATPWYNITVALGWNLISVPLDGPTTMPAALQDATGGVVWTRAMWYNPQTPADPWKQYNTAWASSLNDLTAVDETMGVWIYVSTLGDSQICVGGTGYSTPTTTAINLRSGWNLVGFPSDDTTYTVGNLKSAVTTVTFVEQYDGGQTYLTSTMADATAFAPGKAYWVFNNGVDAVWNKGW